MMEAGVAAKKLGPREKAFYFRIDPEDSAYVYHWMAETGQTMAAVMQLMIRFCKAAEGFSVPKRKSTLERAIEAKKRKAARYRKLARVK
jgi:hypothetical protein